MLILAKSTFSEPKYLEKLPVTALKKLFAVLLQKAFTDIRVLKKLIFTFHRVFKWLWALVLLTCLVLVGMRRALQKGRKEK